MHIETVTFSQEELRDMLSRSGVSLAEDTSQANSDAIGAHVEAIKSGNWVFSGEPLVIG